METDTVTIEHFIQTHRISMKADLTDRNPNMPESRDMDHWKVTLRRGKVRMSLVFSQGYGYHGKVPELADVLDCLASDASTVDNADDFESWCSELGYDPDSRKTEKTWKAVEHQTSRLRTFLDEDLYQQLIWHTERR